ncbi:hypothetical protein SVIOM342S_01034 [Streptomyces violaceorubidus]
MGALTDPAQPLEDVCDQVLHTLDSHHGEDDIALLMARVQGLPSDSVGDWTLPREPRSVGRAREYARAQLLAWDMEPLVDTTELLVSELVTNALRYGEGEIRLRLLLDRTLVCEVWDSGLVQPRRRRARDTDEGGRGLQLVGLLSAAWGSRRTPRGKTVWFELPLPGGDTQLTDPAEALRASHVVSSRVNTDMRVMHSSRGRPLISAEHEPHLPALQFQRTARSGAWAAWRRWMMSRTTSPLFTSTVKSARPPPSTSPRHTLNRAS